MLSTAEKICIRCKSVPRVRGQRWCRRCRNAYARAHRPKYAELSERARLKSTCRAYTNVLIRRGSIGRGPCQVCGGNDNLEAHHTDDYSNPRAVVWLCRIHRLALRDRDALPIQLRAAQR